MTQSQPGEMIERMARAICVTKGLDPNFSYDPHQVRAHPDGTDVRWKLFVPEARAVLQAMREPNADILAAASQARGKPTHAVSASIWRAMITAALEQGE